jgi:hypothetical protein
MHDREIQSRRRGYESIIVVHQVSHQKTTGQSQDTRLLAFASNREYFLILILILIQDPIF